MSQIDEVEVLVRALGLPFRRQEGSLILSYQDPKHGEIGVVISYEESSDTLRIVVPLDVEPYPEALRLLLEENFSSTTYKYALDYEGFIAVVYDLPRRCVKTARDLREAIVEAVAGARRILERSEEPSASPSSGRAQPS